MLCYVNWSDHQGNGLGIHVFNSEHFVYIVPTKTFHGYTDYNIFKSISPNYNQ